MTDWNEAGKEPIAIIGIGCRYPGNANDPESYWEMLCQGVDAVREIPLDRWDWRPYYDPEPGRPGKAYVCRAGTVEGIDLFDPEFFGMSPREAPYVDPQHRMLLEATWSAFEDAGQPMDIAAGSDTGVFVGISTTDYSTIQIVPGDVGGVDAYSATGGTISIAANRISYSFNFQGPSVAIDTACSSSLVAMHQACNALWNGECGMAITAGVNCIISPGPFIAFCSMGMLSPDGKCKAFDASANGFVRGEGVGAILLKPLSKAVADGDTIYALIRSTAVNQDGHTSGMTVPSRTSQENLVREACRLAGVDPKDISYVEAHGTGTAVGDPIETSALGTVLGEGRENGDQCLIGSVKTNIGHLEAGAGVAGVIKLALSLKHGEVPPNLHFNNPNPAIDFSGLNLRVPVEMTTLPQADGPLLGCINSFGFGGTNAHAILEAPPAPGRSRGVESTGDDQVENTPRLLPLTARGGEDSLLAVARTYRDFLVAGEGKVVPPLAEICRSAALRQTHHEYRLALVGETRERMVESLDSFLAGEAASGMNRNHAQGKQTDLVFVFSGQGPQWWAMGRELLDTEPVFRGMIDRCHEALLSLGGWALLDELQRDEESSRMGETEYAQPAIFALQVALAALWKSWGIRPTAVVGHSVGEVAAAHEAGMLDLESAMRVIYHRGRCMEHAGNEGRMIAAAIMPEEAEALIGGFDGKVSLAAINGPTMVSISGCAEILEGIFKDLEERSVFVRYVPVNYAFHSMQMDPVKDELLAALEGVCPRESTLPLYSTVSGELTDGSNFDAEYWWHNVRDTVKFAPAIDRLIEDGHSNFLEISAHPVLSPSITECLSAKGRKGVVIQSLRRQTPERAGILGSLGMLWSLGYGIDWKTVYPGDGSFAKLPRYPWQKESYWNESATFSELRLRPSLHPLLRRRIGSSDPCWETYLDKRAMPYLYDHRVGRHILLPAAAYVEMAMAAGMSLFGDLPFVIEEMEIPRGCVIPAGDEIPLLQFSYDAPDSSFMIHSRLSDAKGAWSMNANGKMRHQPERTVPDRADIASIIERIGGVRTSDRFYEVIQEDGLYFGPHFRGVSQVWATGEEAIGLVELLDLNERDAEFYHFHPAFLDACFQVIGAMDLAGLLLPASIGKIRAHADPKKRVWSHVRLKHYIHRKRAEMDVRIYDEEGNILLEMDSFVCNSAEIATTASANASSDWLYQFKWLLKPLEGRAEKERAAEFLPDTEVLSKLGAEAMGRLDASLGLSAKYAVWQPKIDQLCQAYVLKVFEEAAWRLERGDLVTHAVVMERLGVVPKFGKLVARLLSQLEEDGLLRRTKPGNGEPSWKVSRAPKPADIRKTWREILFHFPAFHPELTLLERSAGNLARILQGKAEARDLLCPGGSMNTIEQYEADSLSVRSSNHALAEAVAASLVKLPEGRRIRILELGAGTGGLTACILPKLPAGRVDYVFSDTDDSFFGRAEQKFQDYGFVDYRVLDIGEPPSEQGFEEHGFDYIIGNGALHKTEDLARAVSHLASLLASKGLVAMAAEDKPGRHVDLVFGTAVDWWKFKDELLRPSYPLIARGKLIELFQERGLTGTYAVSGSGQESEDGRYLLFARGAEVEAINRALETDEGDKRSSWLVFADGTGMADELVAKLLSRGDKCFVARVGEMFSAGEDGRFQILPSSSEDFHALVAAMPEDLTGVIHAWSLDAPGGEQMTTAEISGAEPLVCHSVLYLVQSFIASDRTEKPQLWLVTRGAQPVGESIKGLSLAQSALCGLGRVIINEHSEFRTRMLDLDPDSSVGDADAIIDEILHNDGEEEVALRCEARYVQRLARGTFAPQRDKKRPVRIKDSPCRLETPRPGSLDSLIFRPIERRAPEPDEVEIEVSAAALNFRDVMKALGIYPAEADDAMLLGDECSGRIVTVGSNVKHFKPGDEVMAISAGCFSSHVTTPAMTVLPKPGHLSMEEATTMLVTYMTAAYALHQQGRMRAGEKVLIHAATGGVGQAAVQVAMLAKAEIFATAGTPEKRDFLRYLGINKVMDSRTLSFADEVLAYTDGKGVDLVLNSLAGEAIHKSLSVLGSYGRFLEIGKRDIYGNTKIGLRPFRKNLSYFAIDLGAAMDPSGTGDLMAWLKKQFGGKKLPPLPYRTFPFSDAIEAFRYITQAKQVGKVVLSLEDRSVVQTPDLPKEAITFRSDASYMISGGLGGFGLAVAEWLVEKGARNLVLTGRTGLNSDEARASVAKMEETGAKVFVATSDISVPEDVSQLFAGIKETMPPLGGVFHAAMVLDDGLLTQLDGERFSRAMTPKVNGAWNLHRETRVMDLDFFVMFSSVSSVVGSPGQANYVAANAFLDTLAHHRKLLGLPALVVNWGVLAEVGYVARHKKLEEHFHRMGWGGLTPSQVLPILGRLINSQVNQMVVLKVDWAQWSKTSGRTASSPRYALLTSPEAMQHGNGDGGEWLRNAVLEASPEERQSLMENYLREQIAKVLRTAPEKIEKDRPLNELGLDSLMAVELLHLIENQLSVAIPTGQLMGGPTVSKLAVVLVDNITGGESGISKSAGSNRPDEPETANHDSEFIKDCELDPDIRIAEGDIEPEQITSPRKIFLTGSVEFLGAYLLSEILGKTSAEVHCLIDGENETEAKGRIRETLNGYGLAPENFDMRVHAVLGEITATRFGMEEREFAGLAEEMDAIYHARADVNHIVAYERLKPVNVDGTVEIIRFAGEGKRKPVHYVSSFTVLPARGVDQTGSVGEDDRLDFPSNLIGGYSQSRWVAERLLGAARDRGLPVNIYRPGLLSGDTVSGIASPEDFVWRLLKSCIELGAGPKTDFKVFLTPVDFAAKAMFELSRNAALSGRNFHLLNGDSANYSDLVLLAGECGYTMNLVDTAEWERLVVERGVDLRDNPLAAYLLFMPVVAKDTLHIPGVIPDLDNSNVRTGLANVGMEFPNLDRALMKTYINYFVRTGFFPPIPAKRNMRKQTAS